MVYLCRQDVGLYPARHVCYSGGKDMPPPLPIVDLRATSALKPQPKSNSDIGTSTTTETVEKAKEVVGRGWEAVRNMNWRDMTTRNQESNGSRMWGRLVEATSSARQKVADKYHEVREGGNGITGLFVMLMSYRVGRRYSRQYSHPTSSSTILPIYRWRSTTVAKNASFNGRFCDAIR